MATHKSAIKRWRQSLRRRADNRRNKSILKSQIKKLRIAIAEKNKDEAQQLLPPTFAIIDRCVKKRTIHENKGNRLKSRLSRQVERLNPSPSQ
ncbi:MAG: 30S ribosomal protein S20 [Candidatus Aminicenantes bacterium 4484_214]|nr:MAG: 30S ribosomal protein S20 [Candidatus Aminicenantes bacterium 4484_214]RLE05101.1 MAG: 30S ribosomal protein S20 [Candidatus Aminicenantes bacterium]